MYIEKTNAGYNIMDLDPETVAALSKIITGDNMKSANLKNPEHDKLIELKFKSIKELQHE